MKPSGVCAWCFVVIGCSSSSDPSRPPEREADVLIEAPSEITVIYKDGDADWQLAPQIGTRRGFDLTSESYAIGYIDLSRGAVDTFYTTISEQADFTLRPAPPSALHAATGSVTGLRELGGRLAVGDRTQELGGSDVAFDVPGGLHTIVAGDSGPPAFTGKALKSLAVRRDVYIDGPLALDIDLATEALPTTESRLDPNSCQYRSTFTFGDTAIELGNITSSSVISPHRDQWLAGDRLDVRLLCSAQLFQTNTFASPEAIPTSISKPSTAGGVGVMTVIEDRFHFEWTPYESPVIYQAVVGGAPCDNFSLRNEDYSTVCQHRWTARVTAGWTDAVGMFQLDMITRAELEALGVWDPALELARLPFSAWDFDARHESADVVSRKISAGLIE